MFTSIDGLFVIIGCCLSVPTPIAGGVGVVDAGTTVVLVVVAGVFGTFVMTECDGVLDTLDCTGTTGLGADGTSFFCNVLRC